MSVWNSIIGGFASITTQKRQEAKIKDGFGHYVYDYQAQLADAGTVDYAFTTPANYKWIVIESRTVDTSQPNIEIVVYEGATVSGGTPLTIRDWNRPVQRASFMQGNILVGPTVSATGTEIDRDYILGTDTPGVSSDVGGVNLSDAYRILKPDTAYLVRITNNSGVSTNMFFRAVWVEGRLTPDPDNV